MARKNPVNYPKVGIVVQKIARLSYRSTFRMTPIAKKPDVKPLEKLPDVRLELWECALHICLNEGDFSSEALSVLMA